MNKDELKTSIDKCLDLSADLFNLWVEISDNFKHCSDNEEMTRDIHDIQNRLMALAYSNRLSK